MEKNMVWISLKLKQIGPKPEVSTLNHHFTISAIPWLLWLCQRGFRHRHMGLLTRLHTKFVQCLIFHLSNGTIFFVTNIIMAYSRLLLLLLIKVWDRRCLLISVWSQSWVRALWTPYKMDSSYINCPTFVVMAERQPFTLVLSWGFVFYHVIWEFGRQHLFWQARYFFF